MTNPETSTSTPSCQGAGGERRWQWGPRPSGAVADATGTGEGLLVAPLGAVGPLVVSAQANGVRCRSSAAQRFPGSRTRRMQLRSDYKPEYECRPLTKMFTP
jgi:hypothetical protein